LWGCGSIIVVSVLQAHPVALVSFALPQAYMECRACLRLLLPTETIECRGQLSYLLEQIPADFVVDQ
jgi:hypothetical protein